MWAQGAENVPNSKPGHISQKKKIGISHPNNATWRIFRFESY